MRPRKPHPRQNSEPRRRDGAAALWLYGRHPVEAALANPARRVLRLVGTKGALDQLPPKLLARAGRTEIADSETLARLLPPDAVHQGLVLRVDPLAPADLDDVLARAPDLLVMLDQVSDPHNAGAILRSAAAFGAAAVIVQDRHAPGETGVLAKSASGALDRIAMIRETNLSRALDRLKAAGFWAVGLDERGPAVLGATAVARPAVLVLGAEGAGLRRLVAEHCDVLVRLPTGPAMASLNVSNAAAVALYELVRGRSGDGVSADGR